LFITDVDGVDPISANWVSLATPNIPIANGPRPVTAFTTFSRNLHQNVYSDDPTENPYSITLTFTASNTP